MWLSTALLAEQGRDAPFGRIYAWELMLGTQLGRSDSEDWRSDVVVSSAKRQAIANIYHCWGDRTFIERGDRPSTLIQQSSTLNS